MPDAPGDEICTSCGHYRYAHPVIVAGITGARTCGGEFATPATDTPAETRDEEPERDWTPTTPDDVQWLNEFSAIEHLGLYEEERQRLVAIASALAAAREDTKRLDWLDEDQERVEDVFGEMVRGHGEPIREHINAMIARAAPGTP